MTNRTDPRHAALIERDAANVADPSRCDASWCGNELPVRRDEIRDGAHRYCSDACKSRAYRERHGGAS